MNEDKCVREPKEIESKIESLSKTISVLETTYSNLEKQLEPVLSPESPADEMCEGKQLGPQSPLAKTIDSYENRISSICRRINDLSYRIQL